MPNRTFVYFDFKGDVVIELDSIQTENIYNDSSVINRDFLLFGNLVVFTTT